MGMKRAAIRNRASNTVTTFCMLADGNYIYCGKHFAKYIIVKSLCCPP